MKLHKNVPYFPLSPFPAFIDKLKTFPTAALKLVLTILVLVFLPGSNDNMASSYPDLASPTDSVIAGDFGSLSAEEQVS